MRTDLSRVQPLRADCGYCRGDDRRPRSGSRGSLVEAPLTLLDGYEHKSVSFLARCFVPRPFCPRRIAGTPIAAVFKPAGVPMRNRGDRHDPRRVRGAAARGSQWPVPGAGRRADERLPPHVQPGHRLGPSQARRRAGARQGPPHRGRSGGDRKAPLLSDARWRGWVRRAVMREGRTPARQREPDGTAVVLRVIGRIRTPFLEAPGTPIQPSCARSSEGTVILDERYWVPWRISRGSSGSGSSTG